MRNLTWLLLVLLCLASLPTVRAAPGLSKGSFAEYQRVTTSSSNTLNGTFRWDVQAVSGEPPIAKILVLNNQSFQSLNFSFAIDLSSRIEIPSYTVASQNPSTDSPIVGTDHPTRTFFWIDPNPTIGSVIDTVLGSAYVNGSARVTLSSGTQHSCWTLVSQTLGKTAFGPLVSATIVFWFDQKTGLLIKLDSESKGQFSRVSDTYLLQNTNINSLLSIPLTLTAIEWASLTMSVIALILGGIAVAVAMDLRQFRGRKVPR